MKSEFDRQLILSHSLCLSIVRPSTRFLLRIPAFPVGVKNCKDILRLSFRALLLSDGNARLLGGGAESAESLFARAK